MYVVYYASMLRCWQLVWILVKTNHPCLRVGHHMHVHDDLRHDGSSTTARADTLGRDLGDACHGLHLMPTRRRHIAVEDPGVPPSSEAPSCFSEPRLPTIPAMASATAMEWEDAEPKMLVMRKPYFGLPTAYPTCLPVFLYLRMAQVPFDIHIGTSFPDAGEFTPQSHSLTPHISSSSGLMCFLANAIISLLLVPQLGVSW
jgi:hypothetical protein